jgi:hypothetical protein
MNHTEHTVETLRRNKYKVRVIHRFFDPEKDQNIINIDRIASDGHPCVTSIDVTTPDGRNVSGMAYRRKGDQYSRKMGVKIALGRAMKQLSH